jgi:phenylalanine-4-hydroxylase
MHTIPRRASRSERDLVWRTLFERQIGAVRRGMAREFLAGTGRAGLDPARMPRHGALSRRLARLCGWRIETVPGLIPVRDFVALLRDRHFPAPDWIRHPDDLLYTPAPDAFHDLFGHVPQLASRAFVPVLESLAARAEGASDAQLARIERVYWFTIEFGLARQEGGLRAMGPGLASSIAELDRALHGGNVLRRPFTVEAAERESFHSDRPQELYLVAPGLAELGRLVRGNAAAPPKDLRRVG